MFVLSDKVRQDIRQVLAEARQMEAEFQRRTGVPWTDVIQEARAVLAEGTLTEDDDSPKPAA